MSARGVGERCVERGRFDVARESLGDDLRDGADAEVERSNGLHPLGLTERAEEEVRRLDRSV